MVLTVLRRLLLLINLSCSNSIFIGDRHLLFLTFERSMHLQFKYDACFTIYYGVIVLGVMVTWTVSRAAARALAREPADSVGTTSCVKTILKQTVHYGSDPTDAYQFA